MTTEPWEAICFEILPARGAGTSTVILSVSSSTSVSPEATGSPSFLSQLETVASTIDSPSGGTFISSILAESGMRGNPISCGGVHALRF